MLQNGEITNQRMLQNGEITKQQKMMKLKNLFNSFLMLAIQRKWFDNDTSLHYKN